MASKEAAETEVNAEADVAAEAGADTEQVAIDWAEDLINDFKPVGVGDTDNGEAEDEPPEDAPVEEPDEPADEPEEKQVESDLIGEADYARNVKIANKDGSVTHKTVQQLIDGGMLKDDHTRKTQELARQRQMCIRDSWRYR